MIVVTGFQGYGGRGENPASHLASGLNGERIEGHEIVGRVLPVDLDAAAAKVPKLLDEFSPDIVLSIGLWPGEAMIRLERLAANHSHFELTDEVGNKPAGPVRAEGPDAYITSLPIDDMQRAVRDEGIPCRISGSTGTFLCNAIFYMMADECARRGKGQVGFVHVPYVPGQVAELLDKVDEEAMLEQHQRSDYASMNLSDMKRGLRAALACAAKALQ